MFEFLLESYSSAGCLIMAQIGGWNIDYILLYAFRSFNVGNSRTIFHFDKLYIWLSHPFPR